MTSAYSVRAAKTPADPLPVSCLSAPLPFFALARLACRVVPFSLVAAPAHSRADTIDHGNFIQVAARSTASTGANFIVIRNSASTSTERAAFSREGSVSQFTAERKAMPSERVLLDDDRLNGFASEKKLALRPVFVHLSQRPTRDRDLFTVIGLRGREVWRYELVGASRRLTRVGEEASLSPGARADHENAVVGSRLVLAYRPTRDLPSGLPVSDAEAPVLAFVRTGEALFQVSRFSQGSFTISQIGVVDSAH